MSVLGYTVILFIVVEAVKRTEEEIKNSFNFILIKQTNPDHFIQNTGTLLW